MSVFFTVVGRNQITMLSDSQGTRIEDGAIIHDAQKLWQINDKVLVSVGGDANIGELCLRVAYEMLEEESLLDSTTPEDVLDNIRFACTDLNQSFSQQVIQDYGALFQVCGVSSGGVLQLFQMLAVPGRILIHKIIPEENFPVHILPPPDVPYSECQSIVSSTARRLFPHTSRLTTQQWIEAAQASVEEVARRSQYVDAIPQQLTVYLEENGFR